MPTPPTPDPATGPLTAGLMARGLLRALAARGHASLVEFPLGNGRRADICALAPSGEFVIVEIKTSPADLRADRKWPHYLDYADRFYFAVPLGFPTALIPEQCGLMVADAFGAEVLRAGPATPLPAARRRALTLRFARLAAARLSRLIDPEGGAG